MRRFGLVSVGLSMFCVFGSLGCSAGIAPGSDGDSGPVRPSDDVLPAPGETSPVDSSPPSSATGTTSGDTGTIPEDSSSPPDDVPTVDTGSMPDTASTDSGAADTGSADLGTDTPDTSAPPPSDTTYGGKRFVAYFAEWSVYGRNYHVTDIPPGKLTHIHYAFLNLQADGTCVLGDPYAAIDKFYPGDTWDAGALRGSFHQLELLKKKTPNLKVLLSVGGWTWSTNFSDVAKSDAARRTFATSCTELARKYHFDGIDIDWEYPGGGGLSKGVPEDKANYVSLLKAIRSELDGAGSKDSKRYELTIAAPAGEAMIKNLDLVGMTPLLDAINIMTYDFHGGWERVTDFNSPLYGSKGSPAAAGFHTDGAVAQYLSGGVPAKKLVVGGAYYGRGWSGVGSTNNGLFQPATGLPKGTWEDGIFDYKDLKKNYLPSAKTFFHAEAAVPWLYDEAKKLMISYDDPASLTKRADYVKSKGLGGIMIWELSGDDTEHSLTNAISSALAPR